MTLFENLNNEQLKGADYAFRLLHTSTKLKGAGLELVESMVQETVDEMNARNKQPPKTCNCLVEAQIALEKQHGTIVFEDGVISGGTRQPGPIRFKYHPKKSNGERSENWAKSFIVFNYCPLCGSKYPEKK